mmetsp:Transcript_13453/g.28010  ORF Transcript_13453/g.28010 Transcript_13453/m.28010 type:complete len:200 (+) Transcript_13453:147-746(+)
MACAAPKRASVRRAGRGTALRPWPPSSGPSSGRFLPAMGWQWSSGCSSARCWCATRWPRMRRPSRCSAPCWPTPVLTAWPAPGPARPWRRPCCTRAAWTRPRRCCRTACPSSLRQRPSQASTAAGPAGRGSTFRACFGRAGSTRSPRSSCRSSLRATAASAAMGTETPPPLWPRSGAALRRAAGFGRRAKRSTRSLRRL